MNKSLLKFITDFGPLLIFFTVYYKSDKDLIVAIPPLIIATIIAVVIVYFVENVQSVLYLVCVDLKNIPKDETFCPNDEINIDFVICPLNTFNVLLLGMW